MSEEKKEEDWKLSKPHWRDMHGLSFVEAYCSHGIGHHKGVHGCDGCCDNCPKEIWDKLTDETDD